MKILNLIQCTNLGGMEQASLRLMCGLMERGDSVELLSLNPIGRLDLLLEEAGIPHEGLPYLGKGGWRSCGLLKQKLKHIQADGMIMTGHHLLGSLALGDFCKGRRVLAIHFHHEGVKSSWQWRLIYRIACQRFNAITFPCDFIRKEAEAIFPPVARLSHTVRNPLDIPLLPTANEKAEARRILNLPPERPIIGNAGWLIPRKRFDVFLHTAHKILNKNPNVLFAIGGGGPESAKLKLLADELGIAGSIRWLGWQQDMDIFYKSLDILLFNSDWDALPCTPQEAMSFGIPVVCSVVNGGINEIISSKEVGFLLPTHDVDVLAERVLQLLAHPNEAAAIGLAGRKHLQKICEPGPIAEWHAKALSGRILSVAQKPKSAALLPKNKRTAILFHRVGPYHFARVRAMGQVMDTTLIEAFKSDDTYKWDLVTGADGFKRMTLFENPQAARNLSHAVRVALDSCRPDAVAVPGWANAMAFSAIQWCGTHGIPAIIMSETTEWDEQRRPWKEWIKRRILKMCSAGFVGGSPHAEYLARLGMPRERLFQGYDAVDNEYFSRKAKEARDQKPEIKRKYELPENYFLASARFVQKKNLANLIRAYAQYRELAVKAGSKEPGAKSGEQGAEDGGRRMEDGRRRLEVRLPAPWSLVLLGDGPLKSELTRLISELRLERYVLLPGFKQYEELPAYYALAKAFIHPSSIEQWGLVVNEAMASGLPVLVSNRCGCARDLVQEGVNGFTFDPDSVEQLAQLMLKISDFAFPLSTFGVASARIISNWGPEQFATGLSAAVSVALNGTRKVGRPKAIKALNAAVLSMALSYMDKAAAASGSKTATNRLLVFHLGQRKVLAMPAEQPKLRRVAFKRFHAHTAKRRFYQHLMLTPVSLGIQKMFSSSVSAADPIDIGIDYERWVNIFREKFGDANLQAVFVWPSQPERQRMYIHLFDERQEPCAFVKIVNKFEARAQLETGFNALIELRTFPFQHIRLPQALGQGTYDGKFFTIQQPLPVNSRPPRWRQDKDVSSLVREICAVQRRFSAADIIQQSWWKKYVATLPAGGEQFHAKLMSCLEIGAEFGPVHGDFGPANMAAEKDNIWLFDWENFHHRGPVLTDIVGYFLSFSVGNAAHFPAYYKQQFTKRFLNNSDPQRRLDIMLALAFRHSSGISDAEVYIRHCSWNRI